MKVLLGIPVHHAVEVECLDGLLDTLLHSKVAEFVPVVVKGPYVNVNRNKIVDAAHDGNCDDIVMVDSDMEVTREHIERLLSHDVDIVGAKYCKRVEGKPQWNYHCNPDAQPTDAGLLPVNDVGTGAIRIRASVFSAFRAILAGRRYRHRTDPIGSFLQRTECFPIGIYEGEYLGEDVFFCRLAQELGFQPYVDLGCVVRHRGMIGFPAEETAVS